MRYFNLDDSLSLADIEREATVGQHFQIGCALLLSNTSASGKPPPQPHDATAYYEMARRLAEFMLASQRWSSDEAHAASDHVTFVMRLFEKFPATDVMLYDEDFRTERHRLQQYQPRQLRRPELHQARHHQPREMRSLQPRQL